MSRPTSSAARMNATRAGRKMSSFVPIQWFSRRRARPKSTASTAVMAATMPITTA